MSFAAWVGAIIGGTAVVIMTWMLMRAAGLQFDTYLHGEIVTFPLYVFGGLVGGACAEIIFGGRR